MENNMPKTAQQIIETIMTQHWDLAACKCWICEAGRKLDFAPRIAYLPSHEGAVLAHVTVVTNNDKRKADE